MRTQDAVSMLAGSGLATLGPTVWADLGCGDGTFTLALAEVIAPGSVIHAMDRDAQSLAAITTRHKTVRIKTHQGDFTKQPWPFDNLDGILMANSLHYVKHKNTFIAQCQSRMQPDHRFLIVEYDTDRANSWVPYPVGRSALATLFSAAGYASFRTLGSQPSAYRRAQLYAAIVATPALAES